MRFAFCPNKATVAVIVQRTHVDLNMVGLLVHSCCCVVKELGVEEILCCRPSCHDNLDPTCPLAQCKLTKKNISIRFTYISQQFYRLTATIISLFMHELALQLQTHLDHHHTKFITH